MNLRMATILCTLILVHDAGAWSPAPSAAQALPAQGTSKVRGTVDDVAFEGTVEGPSTETTCAWRIANSLSISWFGKFVTMVLYAI